MKTLILSTAIILSSCASVDPVPVRLLPPLLDKDLPRLEAESLSCLSDETYAALVKRDKMQTARRMTLRGINNASR